MKKTLRLISIVLCILSLTILLASCSESLSGSYEADLSVGDWTITSGTLLFTADGDVKYTYELFGQSKVYVGEYEIDKKLGTIEFEFEEDGCSLEGAHEFSMDKKAGTITIGSQKYVKK